MGITCITTTRIFIDKGTILLVQLLAHAEYNQRNCSVPLHNKCGCVTNNVSVSLLDRQRVPKQECIIMEKLMWYFVIFVSCLPQSFFVAVNKKADTLRNFTFGHYT